MKKLLCGVLISIMFPLCSFGVEKCEDTSIQPSKFLNWHKVIVKENELVRLVKFIKPKEEGGKAIVVLAVTVKTKDESKDILKLYSYEVEGHKPCPMKVTSDNIIVRFVIPRNRA